MTAAAVKQRKPKADAKDPVILTWDLSSSAAEVYWPGFGGEAVTWMAAINARHFDNAVQAEPMVFSRTSSTCGHSHPTAALECDPRKGFDGSGPAFAGNGGYQYPKPLQSIRRGDLLRWLMRRYLEIKGLDARVGRDDWNQVMRLHHELTGKRIWASRKTETYREERDQLTGLSRRVLDVDQPPNPQTGQPSLSWDLIRNWPFGSVDLGEIGREGAQ